MNATPNGNTYPCRAIPVLGSLERSAREYPYSTMTRLLAISPTTMIIISDGNHSLYVIGKFCSYHGSMEFPDSRTFAEVHAFSFYRISSR